MAKKNVVKKVTKKKVSKRKFTRKKTVLKKKPAKRKAFPPAYFLSLSVENARCFGPKQTIDVSNGHDRPAQWTVILGDNNTGKTTLLQCFVALEPIVKDSEPLQSDWAKYSVSMESRLFSADTSQDGWDLFRKKEKDTTFIYGEACFGAKITELKKRCRTEKLEVGIRAHSYVGGKHEDSWTKSTRVYGDRELRELICYGYGASRIMGESSLSEKELGDPTASLFKDDVELINAEEWLLQADYSAKASKTSSTIGRKALKRRDQIRDVLINLLPEVNDIRVTEPTRENLKPRVEFKTPDGWVSLNGLSLGYRAMISWMVDLANRMFERYPKSLNPLAEPAIVLIDEIDLHLHPKWQRTIMNFLSERFVNTQFIVTAHSPLVVQAAANANIVLLRREGDHVVIDNNPLSVLGWRADQILTSLFGLESSRSVEIGELQKQRRKLLSKAKLTKADTAELKKIESQMGYLPAAETPEDIEAMDIIRQAAKSVKNRESSKK
ncbi:MAG: AAA family ATPase [Planctomycetota bacterium]